MIWYDIHGVKKYHYLVKEEQKNFLCINICTNDETVFFMPSYQVEIVSILV